jgi:hypothetical protein
LAWGSGQEQVNLADFRGQGWLKDLGRVREFGLRARAAHVKVDQVRNAGVENVLRTEISMEHLKPAIVDVNRGNRLKATANRNGRLGRP